MQKKYSGPFFLLCALLAACSDPGEPLNSAGRLQNADIREASGLAHSNIDASRLWVINDGGAGARLYAVGMDGSDQGVVQVDGARNKDWEDLASFVLDDKPMLLIADIGDNLARRAYLTLYVLEEPDLARQDSDRQVVSWQIDFVFPEGAVDVESVSVDVGAEKILVLSKREIPAVLYELPLRPDTMDKDAAIRAVRLGPVDSLPQPSKTDRGRALAMQDWHWQPTAMEISPSGFTAVILTYRALYLYQRSENQSWYDALRNDPRIIDLGGVRNAEAVAFSPDGSVVFVTTEHRHAPLLRFELE